MTDSDKFWLDDVTELYKTYVFIPTNDMTENQKLNALSRLCIYLILLILLLNISSCIILIPITMLAMIILFKKTNIIREKFEKFDIMSPETLILPNNTVDTISFIESEPEKSVYETVYSVPSNGPSCRMPSPDNPLMNTPPTEYGIGTIPAACNADDSEIQDDIKVNFNHSLFSSVYEVWERENATRQFYTMPNTAVPNNQTEFALWLYGLPPSANCKEEQEACLRYDDLRSSPR